MHLSPPRRPLIEAALGQRPLDLAIDNLRIVNVYTGQVEDGSLGILNGRIVTLDAAGLEAVERFDGGGRYAVPGFIDSHVHLDSSLVTPENLAELIVPRGTTVMLADPMESANVGGYEGLQALLGMREQLPYHLMIEVSSRVPTAPGLETTGGELGVEAVREILKWPHCISLGELDPSKVLGLRDEYLAKVEAAHELGKIANGHAAGLAGRELEAYVCGGLSDDHECVDYEEAFARLRLGLPIFVREGSTERNLVPIITGVVASGIDTRHMMFCTDDKHPDDILEEGHIDFMINRAIELGLQPITAIQMATINAAVHFRVDHMLGSLSPGRWADVVLMDSLERVEPTHVFFKGQLVAQDGKMVIDLPPGEYPEWFRHTVTVTRGKQAADFAIKAPNGSSAKVRVIELYPDQIINEIGQATLQVVDGCVMPDPEQDVLKLAVVERYGKNGNIGLAFVKGFGLKRGALASSVAHDHHNIIVVGTNDEDMAACVRAIEEMQGGLAIAADGELLGALPLPLGGLMSDKPVREVIAELNRITAISHELGGSLPAPFMTISFISLPTVPELGLTDKGLVDVRQHALISGFLE
ncbi:MAG: adenine deaminase [Chloroflexi bacterium]|nr:adenine deaminase [Chloroflexota bacterium]